MNCRMNGPITCKGPSDGVVVKGVKERVPPITRFLSRDGCEISDGKGGDRPDSFLLSNS